MDFVFHSRDAFINGNGGWSLVQRVRAAAALWMSALIVAPALAAALAAPASAAVVAPLELIITPDTFVTELVPLKQWREKQGLRVDIVTTTYIQTNFPAYDLPESIKAYIAARYAGDSSLKYVLLAADAQIIPGRVLQVANRTAAPSMPISDRATTSDFYYAHPNQEWVNGSDKGDDYPVGLKWFGISDSNWSLSPVLSVGRIPVANVSQLSGYVARLLSWEQSPPPGLWQSRVLLGMAVASVPDLTFSSRRLGDDAGVTFSAAESAVAARGLSNISLRDYPNYPAAYDALADRLDSPTFLGEWNLGASLAVLAARDGPAPGAPGDAYSGDGSSSVFAPVAAPSGLQALSNGGKLPVFVAAYGGSANLSMDNDSNVVRALFAPGGGSPLVYGFAGRTGAGTQPGGALGGWTLSADLVSEILASPGRAGDLLDRARARFVGGALSALGGAFDANNASLRRAVAGLTLLGDPGSLIGAGPAKTLDVTLPPGVAPNSTVDVSVTVSAAGVAVPNASVSILDDTGDLQAACMTDAFGRATCPVTTGRRSTWTVHVSAGGFLQATVSLAIDTPPNVVIITPGNGTSVAGRLNFTGMAGDPDASDGVTLVEVALNGGAWMNALGTSAWSLEVDTASLQNGPNTFSARASDGVVWSAPRTATFTVTNAKEPALIAPYDEIRFDEDTNLDYPLDLGLHFQTTGPGATFAASASTTDRLAVRVDNGTLILRPQANFTGDANVTLSVFESYGGSRQVVLRLRVLPVDDPPQLTVASNLTVDEGATVNFDPRASDPDGTPLTLFVESGPQGATPTGWTAPRGSAGVYEIIIGASDGHYIARASVVVTVESHNTPPSLRLSGPANGEAGRELLFSAQDIVDIDGDDVTVVWDFGDGQGAVNVTASHVYAAPGTYTVTLTASDGRKDTVLVGTISIDPYRPPAPGTSAASTIIGFASLSVIGACAVAATYLLFFSRPRPPPEEAPALRRVKARPIKDEDE